MLMLGLKGLNGNVESVWPGPLSFDCEKHAATFNTCNTFSPMKNRPMPLLVYKEIIMGSQFTFFRLMLVRSTDILTNGLTSVLRVVQSELLRLRLMS